MNSAGLTREQLARLHRTARRYRVWLENLHTVWDTTILLERKGKVRVADYAKALNSKISDTDAKAWSKGTPVDWANEGRKIAAEVVYKGVPADGDPPKLDQAYVDRAGPVIDEQLERGGVRLAMILNRAMR